VSWITSIEDAYALLYIITNVEQLNNSSKKPGIFVGAAIERSQILKRVLLVGTALGLLMLAGTLALLFTQKKAAPKPVSQEKISEAVQATVANPDYAAVEAELQNQLRIATDPKKKADIYVRLASLSMQQKQYALAADQLIEAGHADTSRADVLAVAIGDAYLEIGDEQKALPFYKKALAFYESRPEQYSGKRSYIDSTKAKIAEIEK
jgi:tetratricopeptide (TPR) repeat protein